MCLTNIIERIREKLSEKLSNRKVPVSDGSRILLRNATIDGSRLFIGKDVYIGPNATILCSADDVVIGDHVVIGPGVTLVESNHIYDNKRKYIKHSGLKRGGVKIENDCWLGANVTVLAGVTIGKGCVIGACSCVTKSIPPYSVAVGIPAKVIKQRFTAEEIIEYEQNLNNR